MDIPISEGSLVQDFIDMDKFNRSGNFKKLALQKNALAASSSHPRRADQIIELDEISSVLPVQISSWKSQPGLEYSRSVSEENGSQRYSKRHHQNS
jgi:hypothetical protein